MKYILVNAVNIFFEFISAAIIIDALLSWLPIGQDNEFIRILHIFTEPFVSPARKIQNKIISGLMIDFSPMIAIFLLWIIEKILITIIVYA